MNAKCQTIIGLLVVLVLIMGWLLVGQAKGRAMLEARHSASIRLLSEFECNFLQSHAISVEDYHRQFSEFLEQYPRMRLLEQYDQELLRQAGDQPATP